MKRYLSWHGDINRFNIRHCSYLNQWNPVFICQAAASIFTRFIKISWWKRKDVNSIWLIPLIIRRFLRLNGRISLLLFNITNIKLKKKTEKSKSMKTSKTNQSHWCLCFWWLVFLNWGQYSQNNYDEWKEVL